MMRVEISEGKWWVLGEKSRRVRRVGKNGVKKMDTLFIIDDRICEHYLNIPGPVIAKSLYCIRNA